MESVPFSDSSPSTREKVVGDKTARRGTDCMTRGTRPDSTLRGGV